MYLSSGILPVSKPEPQPKMFAGHKDFYTAAKSQLKSVLFQPTVNKNVSFGWSKGLAPEQEKILNILIDRSNKTAIVAAHTAPDGDAYGSCIGVAGILESLGVTVYPCIDDKPVIQYNKMPSAMEGFSATEYVHNARKTKAQLHNFKVKSIDLALITDTAVPERTSEELLNLMAQAKKIVIIDHHPDMAGEKTNRQQWQEAFQKRGIPQENVTYWRELRESACEMIGELDREVEKEAKIASMPHYDASYYKGYRLATASGLTTDVGCVPTKKGQVDKTVLFRLSEKKAQAPDGKFESITRNIFNWLVNTCGIARPEISIKELTRISLPDTLDKHIDKIIAGKVKVPGIVVKSATQTDPLAFVYIEDNAHLEEIAQKANKINKNDLLNARSIYLEIKKRIEERIVTSKDTGVMILAAKNKKYNSTAGSIRSYGYNTLDGEGYIKGHVFTDNLATIITNSLKAQGLLTGGGHANACGFKQADNVDFMKDVLPLVKDIVEKETAGKDLRALPEDQGRVIAINTKPGQNMLLRA